MNKIELHISVNDKENYLLVKGFIDSKEDAFITHEYFASGCFPGQSRAEFFCKMDVMLTMDGYKELASREDIEATYDLSVAMDFPNIGDMLNNLPNIKHFMRDRLEKMYYESGDIEGRYERSEKFIEATNLIQMKIFKQDQIAIDEYIETKALTKEDKLKDINHMIAFFEKDEKYEDCALLMKIKKRIQ